MSDQKELATRNIVNILQVKKESEKHTTISFEDPRPVQPGQFLMVWLPGVDEVPMGYSSIGSIKEFTVHNVGEATSALSSLKEGDTIGIRGPLGHGFKLSGKRILLVGGGTGICPLATLAEHAAENNVAVDMIIGATTASDLLLEERLSRSGNVFVSTDDGTKGYGGYATDLARKMMGENEYDMVYTCGPEIMMRKVVEGCNEKGIACQVSLERYMKCGIGICDSCSVGGRRVCVEGPVFSAKEALSIPEFGRARREADGSLHPL